MWAIKDKTPYASERTWIRDKSGAHRWIVAVKATFDIGVDGAVRLADEQVPPRFVPEHHGEPANSSLRYEADLVSEKSTTDILLNAHAHAPGGKPTRTVTVAFRVGTLTKELRVHGSRVFYRPLWGMALSDPLPFVERPIMYEWAYGGTDTCDSDPHNHGMDRRNPVGKGFATCEKNLLGQPGWSIEYPRGNPADTGPAGFGSIASHWSPRLEFAGTYDREWEQTRKPLMPLNYDERFVLCAPSDQRPPKHLTGGEPVALVNLTPQGLLRFTLPKVFLTFTTRFGRRVEEHPGKLATVLIEPQQMRVILCWQTSLLVRPTDVDYLDETLIRERPFPS
ncbi:DUF2169 domain-containing protein [Archangium sp.]|uniref:DUF2169 family type VI secretion system accessory protein n=1 Tax=Archangium sp. TaxID=1872627 RepID=UPI002D46EE0C|nr:DUF2169 domain-containing protein [Archangium sp.]HYO59313.1 DUF2169 domain-containing protein [Archangium sp.]